MTDMPQTILTATDFSKPAERACDFARDLSRRFQAQLHLLHVVVIFEDPHLEEDHLHRLEELVPFSRSLRSNQGSMSHLIWCVVSPPPR